MNEADSYLEQWLAREPEMELAQLFCAPAERRRVALWYCLQHELDDAAFNLSDATVTQAKLAWWADELQRGVTGAARHPLLVELFQQPGARAIDARRWATTAQRALALALDERSPADVDDLLQRYLPYAAALAEIETALFGGRSEAQALAIERIVRRLGAEPAPRAAMEWPLQLLARVQLARDALAAGAHAQSLRRELAPSLLTRLPADPAAPRHRRMRQALDRWRLQQWLQGRVAPAPSGWRRLWLLWRAARGT
jgi:hypothetical protein